MLSDVLFMCSIIQEAANIMINIQGCLCVSFKAVDHGPFQNL